MNNPIDALNPIGKNCNICNASYDVADEENWIHGYIGMIPVALCVVCYNGLVEMVYTLEEDYPEDELE